MVYVLRLRTPVKSLKDFIPSSTVKTTIRKIENSASRAQVMLEFPANSSNFFVLFEDKDWWKPECEYLHVYHNVNPCRLAVEGMFSPRMVLYRHPWHGMIFGIQYDTLPSF